MVAGVKGEGQARILDLRNQGRQRGQGAFARLYRAGLDSLNDLQAAAEGAVKEDLNLDGTVAALFHQLFKLQMTG